MAYKNGNTTREKILKGSKELFLAQGYINSTYKQIGNSLNINSNLITYHFSNKQTLAKYVLIDYFDAENEFLSKYIDQSYSPMLIYVIRNRIHYQILAQNANLLKFYSEVVSIGLLNDIFLQIPNIKKSYSDFFSYYHLPKKFDDRYLTYLELGSEREILIHFTPDIATDEDFIRFVSSIFPSLIRLPETVIDEAIAQSKTICEKIDTKTFSF